MNTTKQEVPIDHLDYGYISKCTDGKYMEKIVNILRSGKEGKFPDLEAYAEKQLEQLDPKSKVLVKDQPIGDTRSLPFEEQKNIFEDLDAWSSEIKNQESGLHSDNTAPVTEDGLPPVRGSSTIAVDKKSTSTSESASKKKSNQRRDWKDWEKVDIDAEIAKVDEEKSEEKPSAKNILRSQPSIPETVPLAGLTDDQKNIKAEREKEKGNEAFRSGDYSEAVLYYTRSLSLNTNVAARNNRAQAYLKLEKWDKAISDVEAVIKSEPDNVKAYLRRGVALQGKRKFIEARTDLEKVMEMEPNNKRAKSVLEEIERALAEQKTKGRRMVIEETDGTSDEEDDESNPLTESDKTDTSIKSESKIEEVASNPKIEDITSSIKSEKITDNHTDNQSSSVVTESTLQAKDKSDKKAATKIEDLTDNTSEITNSDNSSSKDSNNQDDTLQPESKGESTAAMISESDGSKSEGTASASSESVVVPPQMVEVGTSNSVTSTPAPPAVIETPPPLPTVVVQMKDGGNELFKAGRYPDAITKYTNAINKIESDPRHAVSVSVLYCNRAACKHKTGDCAGCVEDCNVALSLNPGAVKPLLRRATAYETLEKFRHAYVDFQQIVLTERNAERAQQGATRCQNILQQSDGPKWRDKLPAMSPMAANRPNPIFQPVSQTTPPPVSKSDTKESKLEMTKEDKIKGYDAEKEKGNNFVKKGKFSEAIVCYTKCIELCPDNPVAYTNRALCYLRTDQPDQVVEDCDIAMTIEPGNVKALFRKAQACKMLKQYEDSVNFLELVIQLESGNTAAKRELLVVKKYLAEAEAKKKQQQLQTGRKKMKIQEVSSDSDDEEQPVKKAPAARNDLPKDQSQTSSKPKTEILETTKVQPSPKDGDSKPTSIKSNNTDSETLAPNLNGGESAAKNSEKESMTTSSVKIDTNSVQQNAPHSAAAEKSKNKNKKRKKGKKHVQEVSSKENASSKENHTGDVNMPEATGAPVVDNSVKYELKAPKATSQIKPTAGLMGSGAKSPAAPKLEKASAFEFVSAWTSLKNSSDIDQYLALLRQVEPEKLSSVISNKLDGNMINTIVKCAGKLLEQGESDLSFRYLTNLTSLPRFQMNTMFMSGAEKQELKSVLSKLKTVSDSTYTTADVENLGKLYSL